jgi:hypothetical protein
MSANFLDLADFIDEVLRVQGEMKKVRLYSPEYWELHKEMVYADRKITALMPDKNLSPEQIAILKAKGCQAFNIWYS